MLNKDLEREQDRQIKYLRLQEENLQKMLTEVKSRETWNAQREQQTLQREAETKARVKS